MIYAFFPYYDFIWEIIYKIQSINFDRVVFWNNVIKPLLLVFTGFLPSLMLLENMTCHSSLFNTDYAFSLLKCCTFGTKQAISTLPKAFCCSKYNLYVLVPSPFWVIYMTCQGCSWPSLLAIPSLCVPILFFVCPVGTFWWYVKVQLFIL